MFKADDYRLKIKDLEETLGEAKYALDIDNRYEQLKKLKEEQEDPAIWQDLERSAKIGREISSIEGKISSYEKGRKALDDAGEIIDLIEETGEEDPPRQVRQFQRADGAPCGRGRYGGVRLVPDALPYVLPLRRKERFQGDGA